jgi:phosphate starvation-inducible protein PhoH and related proteins
MKDNMWWGYNEKFTEEQKQYIHSIFHNQLTIVNAPAGTGKTTIAVMAARLLGKGLTYVFAPVNESEMGHRPGTQEEKESDYLVPLYDALDTMRESPIKAIISEDMPKDSLAYKEAWIRACSHTFLRGANLKNTTLVIAESQNFTVPQLKKVLTRVHDSTTVIMEGHTGQCDLKNPALSGFLPYINLFSDKPYVRICQLSTNFRGILAQDADSL